MRQELKPEHKATSVCFPTPGMKMTKCRWARVVWILRTQKRQTPTAMNLRKNIRRIGARHRPSLGRWTRIWFSYLSSWGGRKNQILNTSKDSLFGSTQSGMNRMYKKWHLQATSSRITYSKPEDKFVAEIDVDGKRRIMTNILSSIGSRRRWCG